MSSSVPPGHTRIDLPTKVIWSILTAATVFLWHEWLTTHDTLLRLELELGKSGALNEMKHEEFQGRIDQIDVIIGAAPRSTK